MNDIHTLIHALKTKYSPTIELNYSNTFELLVAVILSAQCTDKMVNKVTPELFKEITTLTKGAAAILKEFDIKKTNESIQMAHIVTMETTHLEKLIHSTGFYKAKAANIKKTSQKLIEKFEANVPSTMNELLTLSGVARKTANVILSTAYGKNEGIVVDTHVKRVSQRLRLVDIQKLTGREKVTLIKKNVQLLDYIKDTNAVIVEKLLMNTISHQYWGVLPHLLVKLGRDVCKAQNPKCSQCIISSYCPVSRVTT